MDVKRYRVRGTELDESYRMKKIFAAAYFQECFAEACASRKVAGYDMQKDGMTWLVTDFRIDFLSDTMPFWRDEIEAAAWTSAKTPLFLTVDFSVSANGSEFAVGSSNWLAADNATHKPARLSPHGDKFEIHPRKIFDGEKFRKFETGPFPKAGEIERVIPSSEVDFNSHLTNTQYAPAALEAVPLDFRKAHALRSYRIKFMREALLGDRIIAEAFDCGGGKFFHTMTRQGDGAVLCHMESLYSRRD